MDSYYPGALSRTAKQKAETEDSTSEKKSQPNDLMLRLSTALRKNSFMESKIQSLEKQNHFLSEKTAFLEKQIPQKPTDSLRADKSLEYKAKAPAAQPIIIKTLSNTKREYEQEEEIKKLKNQIQTLLKKNKSDIEKVECEHEKQLTHLKNIFCEKENEIQKMEQLLEQKITRLKTNIESEKTKYEKQISDLETMLADEKMEYDKHLSRLQSSSAENELQIEKLKNQLSKTDNGIKSEKENYEGRLKTERENYENQIKTQEEKYTQKINQLNKDIKEKDSGIHKNYQQQIQKLQNDLGCQIIKINKLARQYKNVKTKWHERIAQILQKKNQELENSKNTFTQKLEAKDLQHQELIKQKNQELENSKNTFTQKLEAKDLQQQELIKQKNQLILKSKQNNKQKTKEEYYKQMAEEKELMIAELNREIENLTENQINAERDLHQKMEKDWKIQEQALKQKMEKEIAKTKQHYEVKLSSSEQKHQEKINNIKNKYEEEYFHKSSELDDRMIELKEEQDDLLHTLRTEMENELIAEKRKSAELNSSLQKDVTKLQKDIRSIESELKMKTFKLSQLEIEEEDHQKELNFLKTTNNELLEQKNSLQVLWENQWPEMQKQKRQIASLQKLNKQLSVSLQKLHTEPLPVYESPAGQELVQPLELNTLLKDIHLHEPKK